MATFSAVDAALAGFNLARKRPMLILAWTGLYLAAIAVLAGLAFLVAGPSLMAMANVSESDDPSAILEAMSGLWLILVLLIPVLFIVGAMFVTAIYRAILRPEEKKLAYVTLGGDEWRILAVTIVYTVAFFALGGAIFGVTFAAGAVVGDTLGGLLAFLLFLAGLALGVWLSVRFSLALAQTFAERRINLFGSWALTAGRFWPLFGMWVLMIVFTIMLAIVVAILSYIPLLVAGGLSGLAQASRPDPSTMTAGVIVGLVLYGVIQMVGSILQSVVMYAPAAEAYRQLTGDLGAAEAFT